MTDEIKLHSDLPPSSADKWMKCHAWLRTLRSMPPRAESTSPAAEEGTLAHSFLESHLKGVDLVHEPISPEMFDALSICTDWISEQVGEKHAELSVDFGDRFGYVGLFGTADLVIDHPDLLTIADLKYGVGLVEVRDNYQLMIYLSGVADRFGDRENYRLVIMQPRGSHFDGPIREHLVSHKELTAFRSDLDFAIASNYRGGEARVGAHCRKWCPALGSCRAVAEYSIHLFKTTPKD